MQILSDSEGTLTGMLLLNHFRQSQAKCTRIDESH